MCVYIHLYIYFYIVIDRQQRVGRRAISPRNRKEGDPHTRGVYPTQGTSRMRTARVIQEEEADTRIIGKK